MRAKPSDAGWLRSSGSNRLECASGGYTLKETALSGLCVEISAISMLWSCLSLPKLSRTFFADARFRPSSIWSPLTPSRTPSIGVSINSWVRISARGETRGKIRDRSPKIALPWSRTLACWKLPFSCAHRMPCTKFRFDLILSKADSGKQSSYSPQKKARQRVRGDYPEGSTSTAVVRQSRVSTPRLGF